MTNQHSQGITQTENPKSNLTKYNESNKFELFPDVQYPRHENITAQLHVVMPSYKILPCLNMNCLGALHLNFKDNCKKCADLFKRLKRTI